MILFKQLITVGIQKIIKYTLFLVRDFQQSYPNPLFSSNIQSWFNDQQKPRNILMILTIDTIRQWMVKNGGVLDHSSLCWMWHNQMKQMNGLVQVKKSNIRWIFVMHYQSWWYPTIISWMEQENCTARGSEGWMKVVKIDLKIDKS